MTGAGAEDRRRAQTDLARLEAEEDLDLAFVAEEAGDRPLTAASQKRHEAERRRRGDAFWADLLFVLTHRRYPPEVAATLWQEIVAHKEHLAGRLGRDPGVAVAALDYLTNVGGQEPDLGLIPASRLSAVAEVALRDALTGLYGRAALRFRLESEFQRFSRFGGPFSLLMIDIDRFKRFNDTFGHPRGDEALREVSGTIRAETRAVDLAARYGGEEFAVVLPSTDGTEARSLAERIRKGVEERFRNDGDLTVSIGIACCPEDAERPQDLVQAADEALYASKGAGRNRTARPGAGAEEASTALSIPGPTRRERKISEIGETMAAIWTRDPASTEGPVTLDASHRGATLKVAERGNHWFASVTFPDGRQWSQACRTEEEAKTLALRAAEAPRE